MIHLSRETEALAKALANAQGVSVDAAIRTALSAQADRSGIEPRQGRRRLTALEMLAVGDEITALPLLDPRSPSNIMDDLNAL